MSGLSTTQHTYQLEASDEQIANHGTVYFETGNIVLLSLRKDNVVTAFKVYKDFLLKYSPVFEGMLSIPSPSNIEQHDGVPLVRLHDEAQDLIPFLEAIHDPTAIPSKKDFYEYPDKVESVFKLSTKYQVDMLLKCLKDTMTSIWPQDLRAWDTLIRHKREELDSQMGDEEQTWPEGDFMTNLRLVLPEPCTAIRIARDYNVPGILPAAYYHLVRISGSAFTESDSDGEHWGLGSQVSPRVHLARLSRSDLIRLLRGIHAIHAFKADLVFDISTRMCHEDRTKLESTGTFDLWQTYDPLETLRLNIKHLPRDFLCNNCRYEVSHTMEKGRQAFWDSLPNFFALGNS